VVNNQKKGPPIYRGEQGGCVLTEKGSRRQKSYSTAECGGHRPRWGYIQESSIPGTAKRMVGTDRQARHSMKGLGGQQKSYIKTEDVIAVGGGGGGSGRILSEFAFPRRGRI